MNDSWLGLKDSQEFMTHLMYGIFDTLGLILLILLIGVFYKKAISKGPDWQKALNQKLQIKDFQILPPNSVLNMIYGLLGISRLLLTVFLLYLYFSIILSLFPWTERLTPILLGFIKDPLHQVFSGFIQFIPNFILIVITMVVAKFILKILRIFFAAIEKKQLHFAGFYPEWAQPTFQLFRGLAIAFSLVIIYPYIPGSNSPAFQGVSVFLGVLLSLGSSSAMSNILAGIVLTYMRSFKLGDRVQISDTMGDIIEKNLLVTRLRTIKNVEISIPNSLVLGNHIVNYSASATTDGLILHTEITIGYNTPWRHVHELLVAAALKTKDVLSTPSPFVLQKSLDDSYVTYEINCFTHYASNMTTIYSDLHQNIQDLFNSANVEIMSPSYKALRDGNASTIPKTTG